MNFILLLLLLMFFPSSVKAHVLETNESVGAVLHVSPNDDPVAGEESILFFEFKDKDNKFTPQACDCTVTIFQNEKEIITKPLFQNTANPSLKDAVITYTFPKKDNYVLKVNGKSLDSSFSPFTLTYSIQVSKETSPNAEAAPEPPSWIQTHKIHIIGVLIITGVVIFAIFKNALSKKKHHE